ncbi:hematopoietic SH2 domain-containing protein homolog [Synchiropus splendidus]|uniref:hematopoietic SH2 domain-containing protein homolog n=1 Tax=Synchiropus splendidus TaxID=270530 RepID=UPI00237DA369|nr:hematopoietic SH2 domain-containing protein homolog [Synchiropus splendidus]XP_053709008.1 hematopoietic SH2 domain-containing protein homolog [Synchiropus splendidus]
MVEQSGSVKGVLDCPESQGTSFWYEVRYGTLPEWFHWGISRKSSEDLLMKKPLGHFLLRVSESRNGYTLSYRGRDRCKHFMIELSADGQYFISGENLRHRSLRDLVDFHRVTPISMHGDLLTVACSRSQAQRSPPAAVLFLETGPCLSFLTPQNNLPSSPRGTLNTPQANTEPVPPVVPPVPMMRKRHLPQAHPLTQRSFASTPAFPVNATRTSNHSASWSASRSSSDLYYAQMDPVPSNMRLSEGGNADTEYLERHFQSLDTKSMSSTLPQEYSTPPPFSPDHKEQ